MSCALTVRPDSYYRGLVEAQLRYAGVREPPIPLDAVAAVIGLPILTVDFPPTFGGAIVVEDGVPVAMVNGAVTAVERRDVLAHLLAHLLVRIDDPSTPYPRALEPHHLLADAMAIEFVTPCYLVREQAAKWFDDHRYLARLFGVSEKDMVAKMLELGLIGPRAVLWES